MVTAIHCDNAQRFLFSFLGHDRSVALGAPWREFLVKATDAMRRIIGVHCERHAVQASTARRAHEAAWVVRLATGLQNPVLDRSTAHSAFVQCVLVIVFA